MFSWWFLDGFLHGFLVVSRCFLGGFLVVSLWSLGGESLCLGGGGVSVVSPWCLGGVSVVSWW